MSELHIIYGVPVNEKDFVALSKMKNMEDAIPHSPEENIDRSTYDIELSAFPMPKEVVDKERILDYHKDLSGKILVIGITVMEIRTDPDGFFYNSRFSYNPNIFNDAIAKYNETLTKLNSRKHRLSKLLNGKEGRLYTFNLYQ